MTLSELLVVVRARRRSFIVCMLLIAAVGTVLGCIWPRKYLASAEVMIDVKAPDPILGAMFSASLLPSYIATQIELISGDLVTRKAVQRLQLKNDPDKVEEWKRWADEGEPFDAYYERMVQKFLDVKSAKQSNIIAISYKDRSPEYATRVANAVLDAYLETELDVKRQGAERYAAWFDTRLVEYRARLEQAQKALDDYQSRVGMVSDERLDIEGNRLAELSAQVAALQGANASASARADANNAGAITSESQSNPVAQGLRAQIAKLESDYGAQAERLGLLHPSQVALRTQIDRLKSQLVLEEANTRQVVASTASGAQTNERLLRESLAVQKDKVARLQASRAEFSVLQREVRNAQAGFDNAGARRNQLGLVSESPESTATVLMAATVPFRPSSPKLLLLVVLVTFCSVVGGFLCALVREARDPRVRNVQDLAALSGAPILEFGSAPTSTQTRRPWLRGLPPRRLAA